MSISLQADPTLPQGYIQVNGTTAATITSTGITGASLADSAVSTAKIANNAVSTAKVADASITAAKLSGGQSGSAPVYGCRAWVNFDGTRDSTGAASTANTNRFIRASGNVASVLRNGVGDYSITFSTAMADTNYSFTGACNVNLTGNYGRTVSGPYLQAPTTSTLRISTAISGGAEDQPYVSVQIFA